ncbi:MAG: RNA polymerase sigma factor [Prolixibacteraceae bacterium]
MSPKEKQIADTYLAEQKKLKGFVRKQVNTNEDAEDIVQEVFMSLTDGFDDILNLGSIINWLYSVAKFKIIDFQRKKKTQRLDDQKRGNNDEEETLSLADILPSFENLPDHQMMQDLIWEQVKESLELLPSLQREVFVLHELEGYSFKQISDMTGLSVNTLLSRKRYALLFLREQLKELFEIIKE